jgi:glycosyltransferase involved in cell wall biosynthesis
LVLAGHRDAQLQLIGRLGVPDHEMIMPFLGEDPKLREVADYFEPGVYGRLLHEKVAELAPGSVSYLHQGLPHSALGQYYRDATVFVAPSLWEEPSSVPLLEAMSAGAAVVATRGGAHPELIDARSGVLVPRGNVQTLAHAINELLEDPARRAAIAQNAQSRAASLFTWDRAATLMLREYRRLVARRALARSEFVPYPEGATVGL